MEHKGGAASPAPAAGSHFAGKQSVASASLRDSGVPIVAPLFTTLHRTFSESRTTSCLSCAISLLSARQFALFICHLRYFRATAVAVFDDGYRTAVTFRIARDDFTLRRQGQGSSNKYLGPAGRAPTHTVRNERTISFLVRDLGEASRTKDVIKNHDRAVVTVKWRLSPSSSNRDGSWQSLAGC